MGYYDYSWQVAKLMFVVVIAVIGIGAAMIFSETTLATTKIDQMIVDGIEKKAMLEKGMLVNSKIYQAP